MIQPRDRLFRPVAASGDTFSVVIRGKQHVATTLAVSPDGTSITVDYEIAVCGSYKVHVRGGKKGTHVIGSPFTLAVKSAPVHVRATRFETAAARPFPFTGGGPGLPFGSLPGGSGILHLM